jgi:hypothetical protein
MQLVSLTINPNHHISSWGENRMCIFYVRDMVSLSAHRPSPGDRWDFPKLSKRLMRPPKGCSRKIVYLTCVTDTPDQLRICSASQCCCGWGDSVISARPICETVICDMLTNISKSGISFAAAAAITVAWRYAHAKIHPLATAQCSYHVRTICEVGDDNFNSRFGLFY